MNILHIFPTAGFDRSITTPVLLGVLLSWLFTETFGWVFAGLVVPGYLAAVFVLDPRAGMVDVMEAVLTYGVARLIGEHLARTGVTSRVFGRERFLLVVVVSVVVRLAVEGLILPRFAPHAANSFFSIGLVVVPLAANACWKTGLGRGILQNGLPTLLVYLILAYVLVPHTNISMQGFALATEDVAASFLASPKAYILLITGAILAAAANVADGWDFNGILVPALLALVVIEPVKFVATFAEAIVLVLVVALLLRTTRLGRWNIEGPRRLVLFFTVDYVLRFGFAMIAGRSMSGLDVVGLMGFGYLLPTLLAVKINQKGSAALVLLPTAQVAVGAFALGTLIGFCASVVDTGTPPARAAVLRPIPKAPNDPALAALWTASLSRHEPADRKLTATAPKALVDLVDALLASSDGNDFKPAEDHHYDAQRLDDGVLLLRERFEGAGDRWGDPSVLATKGGRDAAVRIVAYVPTPSSTPESAAIAGKLLSLGAVDATVIAGVDDVGRALDAFETNARDTARALADRGKDHGIVVGVLRAEHARIVVGEHARNAPRVEALIATISGKIGAIERSDTDPGGALDVALELPLDDFDRLVEAPAAEKASLSSPESIASALDGVHLSTTPASTEELLATRRLLLEPLLSPDGVIDGLPLVVHGAAALGYRVIGPTHLAGGGEGVAIVPATSARPIAFIARTSGVRAAVLEVPLAASGDLRDAAIRLGSSMHADAYLFGLEPGRGARGGDLLRLAHAIATYPTPERRTELVLVRDGGLEWDDGGVVALGTWGGNARDALLADVKGGLARAGVTATETPIDLPARELAGRAVLGDVAVVSVLFDGSALRDASLDEARAAARALLSTTGVPAIDAEPVDVAEALAKDLPPDAKAPEDLFALARRATLEESVVDRRALAKAVATNQVHAAIARGADGDALVLVARDTQNPKRILVLSVLTDPRTARDVTQPTTSSTLRACAPALAAGGTCLVEAL